MSSTGSLDRQIATVADAVRRAWHELDDGRPVDLDRIEDGVGRLHAAIAALPSDVRTAARPRMLALLADLDAFHAALRATHAETRAQLDDMGARRRAVSAYTRPAK